MICIIRCALHFLLGASWGILLFGSLFFIFNFGYLGLILATILGGIFGFVLVIFFYLLIAIFEANVKLRNHRS